MWKSWMHPELTNLTLSVPTHAGKGRRKKMLKMVWGYFFLLVDLKKRGDDFFKGFL